MPEGYYNPNENKPRALPAEPVAQKPIDLEACAKAAALGIYGPVGGDWARLPDSTREVFRAVAAAVLKAAGVKT